MVVVAVRHRGPRKGVDLPICGARSLEEEQPCTGSFSTDLREGEAFARRYTAMTGTNVAFPHSLKIGGPKTL